MANIFPDSTEAQGFLSELEELKTELEVVLPYTRTLWDKHPRHFPYTIYGFIMCLFSKIDLFSKFWFPNEADQTRRMVRFLRDYLEYREKESEVAVQFWRHKLMHTSSPRELLERNTGKRYRWLLQHTLESGHWQFQTRSEPWVLNVGLFNLLSDLQNGLQKAIDALKGRQDLLNSWADVKQGLAEFRPKF